MTEIFVVGSIWFWALLAAEIVLLFVFTEYDNGVAAFISLAVFVGALHWLGDVNLIDGAKEHPFLLVGSIACYILIGLIWLIFKWRHFAKVQERKHDELFAQYLDRVGLPHDTKVLPEQYRAEWVRVIDSTRRYDLGNRSIADVPLFRHNKAKAGRWFMLWPFSMSLYFLKDLVREFWNWVYSKVARFLQSIADNIWAARPDIAENLNVRSTTDQGSESR